MRVGVPEKAGPRKAADGLTDTDMIVFCVPFLKPDSDEVIRKVHAVARDSLGAVAHGIRRYVWNYATEDGDTSPEVLELRAQIEAEGGLQ